MGDQTNPPDIFYDRIRDILESARIGVARTVNKACYNWQLRDKLFKHLRMSSKIHL
jgi:hypothetical protein